MMIKEILEDVVRKNLSYDDLKDNIRRIAPTVEQYDTVANLMDYVYYMGVDDGECTGYKDSLKDNSIGSDERDELYDTAYDEGRESMRDEMERDSEYQYDSGYESGYESGNENGYEEGLRNGREEGQDMLNEKYEEGYGFGREEGYEEGYDAAKLEYGD